jgi:hypothetical protein
LEDESEYFWEAHTLPGSDEPKEDRWWSPEPQEPSSEEDEEEARYLTETPGLEPQRDKAERGESPALADTTPRTRTSGPTPPCVEEQGGPPGTSGKGEPPRTKEFRPRKLRKKMTKDKDHEWEVARQDAWLREMLTDSSGSESEEKYTRFAESGRWIAEMTRVPQQAATTSKGECSGQEKPGS